MTPLAPSRIAAPSVGLLDLEGAKLFLRVNGSDEDMLIQALIDAAEARIDGYSGILGRALVTQTWVQSFDCFPGCDRFAPHDRIRLPLGSMQQVTSVSYYDTAGVQQNFTAFHAVSDAIGPLVVREWGAVWPQTQIRPDAVTITWICGYGADPAVVPAPIRTAALLLVGDWYENREDTVAERGVVPATFPNGVAALLEPYRAVGV